VIVAAEMLTGGVGIGFWVWDEWNNLNVEHIIIAIFVVGIVGLLLEQLLLLLARRFDYAVTGADMTDACNRIARHRRRRRGRRGLRPHRERGMTFKTKEGDRSSRCGTSISLSRAASSCR
jgi:hypothetical protein